MDEVRNTRAIVLCVTTMSGCGSEQTGYERFESQVLPILEARCVSAACHGVTPGAEARGEVVDWTYFFVRTDVAGRITDPGQAYERAKSRINTVERPEFSTLIRKPLPVADGGLSHYGGDVFTSPRDDAYLALRDWIATETEGGEGKRFEDMGPLAQQFATDVLPALATRQCMNQNCHGPTSPFTSFVAPMLLDGDFVFPTADVEKNYQTSHHFLAFGDVRLSRLIRKILPLDDGGIAHRGGNRLFFTGSDDSSVQSMIDWANLARTEIMGTSEPRPTSGVVFVRGPVVPTQPFELRVWSPGTDLWIIRRQPEVPFNQAEPLTSALHPKGHADARDPAISHDATRVAFSMRLSKDDAHNIYDMALDGSDLRQLTFDKSGDVANRQPVYGPDGRIYFASNRAGHAADGIALPDCDVWAVNPQSKGLEQITFSPSPEARPFWLGTGKSYGTLGFTMLRTLGGQYEGAVFRMPLDHNKTYHPDPEIHIHHGITMPEDVMWAMRTMQDGRFAAILLNRESSFELGALAIVERQFGPVVPEGAEEDASVMGFRQAVMPLDGRLWRDPAPADDPEGTLFAAVADGDPTRPRIARLWLEEDVATGRPRIRREVLLTDLDPKEPVGEWEPEPIVPRALEDDPTHEWDWDPLAGSGFVNLRHVETLDALFSHLEVRGERPVRDDIRYVRLVESIPVAAGETSHYTLTPYGPARVLGEIAVPDGSVFAEVPANTPFRTQFLNAQREAVGAQHNRWNHVAGGEKFPGGVSPEVYPTTCAGCHGSLSGEPTDTLGPPDAITRASITMATHENRDPRHPKSAVLLGAATRIEIDFADVRPIIENCCSECPRPTVSGDFDTLYEYLLEQRIVVPAQAAESSLLAHTCTDLTEEERLAVVRWIDVGAPYRMP